MSRPDGIRYLRLGEFHQRLKETLTAVATRGVAWKGGRFEKYLDALEEAAKGPFPKKVDFEAERDVLLFLTEAFGQAGQLISSSDMWPSVNPDILHKRLKDVVWGSELPVTTRGKTDNGRNFLLELAVGGLFHKRGFSVQLTDAEDLVISRPGLVPMPVECKRPWSEGSVDRNVDDVRSQLGKRKHRYPHGGIAAIGIDAAVGLSGHLQRMDTEDQLQRECVKTANAAVEYVRHEGGTKLAKNAAAIFVLLAGGVFCSQPGRMCRVLQSAWTFIDDRTPKRATLIRKMKKSLADTGMLLPPPA